MPDRKLLADARAHPDHAHEVRLPPTGVVEDGNEVVGVLRSRGCRTGDVRRLAESTVVERENLVARNKGTWRIAQLAMAERPPAAHQYKRLAIAVDLVVDRRAIGRARRRHYEAAPSGVGSGPARTPDETSSSNSLGARSVSAESTS